MTRQADKHVYHEFVTETDSAKETQLDYQVEAESILLDLKVLLREYYAATFTVEEKDLKLRFTNGQSFIIKVEETN